MRLNGMLKVNNKKHWPRENLALYLFFYKIIVWSLSFYGEAEWSHLCLLCCWCWSVLWTEHGRNMKTRRMYGEHYDWFMLFYDNRGGHDFNKSPWLMSWLYCSNPSHQLFDYLWTDVFTDAPHPRPLFTKKTHFLISIGIPIINLRWSSDHLRFIMGIPIPMRRHLFSK